MNSGILSGVIEEGINSLAEARTEEYVMVNVRPGEKVSALLDLLARLTGKAPSALMADRLSVTLADYAMSSPAHTAAILNAVETVMNENGGLWDGCALSVLQERGVFEVEPPWSRIDFFRPSPQGDG